MRVTACLFFCITLASACKTTRTQRAPELSLDQLENEEQLPACDDITAGRAYWVKSLNQEMHCEEGGTWQPRSINPEVQDNAGSGPRTIH